MTGKSERGFAAMDPEEQREIASKAAVQRTKVAQPTNLLPKRPPKRAASAVKQ